MRAGKLLSSIVVVLASLSWTSSFADGQGGSSMVLAAVDAAPMNFSSTAVPQSVRSPDFAGNRFSPQVELAYSSPVAGPMSRDRMTSIPADSVAQRSPADSLLLALLGFTLIAYQLFRKHRLLRPQPFSL
jgi:hypothetical protein